MADDTTTGDTIATTATTEATESTDTTADFGEKPKFTQSQLDRILEDRLARQARQLAAATTKPSNTRTEKAASKAETGPAWTWNHEDELSDLAKSEGVELSKGLKRRMRDDFEAKRPGDLTTWAKDWWSDLPGLKAANGNNATATTQQSSKSEQNGSEVKRVASNGNMSDRGTASGESRDYQFILDNRPGELTAHDIQWLQNKHGFEKANAMIAEKVRTHLKTIKLVPDRRR